MDDLLEGRPQKGDHQIDLVKMAAERLLESTRPELTTNSAIALNSHRARVDSGVLTDINNGIISGATESASDPFGHFVRVGITSAVAWRAACNHNLNPFRGVAARVAGAAVLSTIGTRVVEQFLPNANQPAPDRSAAEALAHETTRFAADVLVAGGVGLTLGRSKWLSEGERLIDNIIEREKMLVFTGSARSYCRGGKMRYSKGYYVANESANAKATDIAKILEWREQSHLLPEAFDALKAAKPDWKRW